MTAQVTVGVHRAATLSAEDTKIERTAKRSGFGKVVGHSYYGRSVMDTTVLASPGTRGPAARFPVDLAIVSAYVWICPA